ncbi:hypothetical protein ACYF6T_01890 [Streptomyces sp. 7R007]
MHRFGTAVSRRVRATALAVATAAAVTTLAWTASAARPDGTATTAVSTPAVALADADTIGLVGTDPRPLPGRLPADLRADLEKLRTMDPPQRQQEAARIWQDALAGRYGTRVRTRAETAQRRFRALPEQLRQDLTRLRGLTGDARDEQRTAIRDKALAGGYGEQVRRWAERRSRFRQQDRR